MSHALICLHVFVLLLAKCWGIAEGRKIMFWGVQGIIPQMNNINEEHDDFHEREDNHGERRWAEGHTPLVLAICREINNEPMTKITTRFVNILPAHLLRLRVFCAATGPPSDNSVPPRASASICASGRADKIPQSPTDHPHLCLQSPSPAVPLP